MWFDGKYWYRINEFDLKIYKCDDPETDTEVHDNDILFGSMDRKRCMYCNKTFTSRSRLFTHLGFTNIDIRKRRRKRKLADMFENLEL